jgi:type I restriction enzyme S subunit
MTEWPLRPIRSFATVFDGPHATPQTIDQGPLFLGITSLVNGRLDLSATRHVSEDDFVKWTRRIRPEPGDVVFSYETKIGEAALIPEGMVCCLGRRMGLVRLDRNKMHPRFFLYAYLGEPFQEFLRSRTVHGATVDRLLLKDFPDFPFPVPPFDKQEAIAAVLGALDDKIELNRRMGRTLEEMARALFKSWFVDFDPVRAKAAGQAPAHMDAATAALFPDRFGEDGLPEGWRLGCVSDLVEFNPRETLRKGAEAPYLDMKALPTSGPRADAPVMREFTSGTKFRRGDVLLARITPCLENGKSALVDNLPEDSVGWGSTEFIVMRGQNGASSGLVYCLVRFEEFRDCAVQSMVGSSGRQRVQQERLENFGIAIPPVGVLDGFASLTDTMFAKVSSDGDQSETLTTLRDTLLPKLMSGELRVRDAERQVAEVA